MLGIFINTHCDCHYITLFPLKLFKIIHNNVHENYMNITRKLILQRNLHAF